MRQHPRFTRCNNHGTIYTYQLSHTPHLQPRTITLHKKTAKRQSSIHATEKREAGRSSSAAIVYGRSYIVLAWTHADMHTLLSVHIWTHTTVSRAGFSYQKKKKRWRGIFQLDCCCFVQTMHEKLIRLKIKDDAVSFSWITPVLFKSSKEKKLIRLKKNAMKFQV